MDVQELCQSMAQQLIAAQQAFKEPFCRQGPTCAYLPAIPPKLCKRGAAAVLQPNRCEVVGLPNKPHLTLNPVGQQPNGSPSTPNLSRSPAEMEAQLLKKKSMSKRISSGIKASSFPALGGLCWLHSADL